MGSTTPKLQLPYPVASDTADVPRDVKALADRLDLVIPPGPWALVTYTNNWGTSSAGLAANYMKDGGGFVHLRGRITGGTNGSVAFILPAGFRPAGGADIYAAGGYGGGAAVPAALAIDQNGNVVVFYGTGAQEVGLGGVTFHAEN